MAEQILVNWKHPFRVYVSDLQRETALVADIHLQEAGPEWSF